MIRSPDDFEPSLDLSLHDEAIAYVFSGDTLILSEENPRAMPWRHYRALGIEPHRVHSVGRHQGRDHIAVALDTTSTPTGAALAPGLRAAGLRQWFGELNDLDLSIAMRAIQLLEWDRTHRYCGACGTATELLPGERARRCPACSLATYPRIAPAMMVMVTRGRQMLLGRGLHFPPGRYSALAGFVEAGETIEQAVVREVREEVGIDIRDLRYFGSQSWPFPHSLMIAFRAEWAAGEIRIDPHELADAQWFDPEALPAIPPRLSIARALIDATLAELCGSRER
jgi:NAD+ diphosphatase